MADDETGRLNYSGDPVLLTFGDHEEGLAAVRAAARRVGCRIAAEAPIAGAAARFDAQVGADSALVLAAAPSPDLDALLDRLSFAARAGSTSAIIVAPPEMIDVVARDLDIGIEHLIAPAADELDQALLRTTERTPDQLHDVRRNGSAMLQQLSEDVARIASVLAAMTEEEGKAPAASDDLQPSDVDAPFVRSIIRARRLRDQFFKGEIFADPAFDVLLDLYAARLENNRVAVSSLCIAAAVPATTALRWIKQLTDKGLLVRTADPRDGRRIYIALSDDASRAMGRYLSAVQRSGLPAI